VVAADGAATAIAVLAVTVTRPPRPFPAAGNSLS
jgi:hypothetical protein